MTGSIRLVRVVILLLTTMTTHQLLAKATGGYHAIRRETLPSARRHLDYQTCEGNLDLVSDDGEVTAQQFLDFLALQTGGILSFENFNDVPLDLRVLFYVTACSGGQDCSSQTPKLTLKSEGMQATLLQIFCAQMAHIVEEQPDALRVSFHYNLYYRNDMTPEEIMSQDNGNSIVPRLETATEKVVALALGCSEDDLRRRRRQVEKQPCVLYAYPVYDKESRDVQLLTTETEQAVFLRTKAGSSRHLQKCEYTVKAFVEDLIPYECDPPAPSNDIQCALVSSSVLIGVNQEGDAIDEEQRNDLRATVVTSMSDSVKDGSFESHLP